MIKTVGYIAVFVLLMVGCDPEPKSKDVAPIEHIDSTAYYDSIYAPLKEKIHKFFNRKHKTTTFYGNVLFAKNGNIIFQNSYGYSNFRSKEELTLEHTFQLASASKPFTAVATLILYEQGKINLTDTIQKFIPTFPYPGITIHQLLCHRSGLSKYTHFCDNPSSVWPDKSCTIYNDDVIEIMSRIVPNLAGSPNRRFYYCNTNYLLLASIIEKVSGMSYPAFLSKYIFTPLKMSSTVVYYRDNDGELIKPVRGYTGRFKPCINIYLNGCVGDKGIYSSVGDMLKFDQALYDTTLLTKETLNMAFTGYSKPNWQNKTYGYGFRILNIEGIGKVVYHSGWWKGFRSYFMRLPEKKETVIVLSHVKRGRFLKAKELFELLKE